MRHLPLISLVVMVIVAISWQFALNHSYDQGKQAAAAQRRATFPVVPVPEQEQRVTPAPPQETEKRLGPFPIAGRMYAVVLRQKSSSRETGDATIAMEIQDTGGGVLYKRSLSSPDISVSAHTVRRGGGTGLMLNYSLEAKPVRTAADTTWWQLFGIVDGVLTPFTGPLAVQGDLLDSQLDTLDFGVWANHLSLIFPLRIDWQQGRLRPEQNCEVLPCQFKVIPIERYRSEDAKTVRVCRTPERCAIPEMLLVTKDTKVDVLSCRTIVHWREGNVFGPTDTGKSWMDDQGEIKVPIGDVWAQVRLDGKEGWVHDPEDFASLGLPMER